MPLFDFACTADACQRIFEQYLPLDRYKDCPPCPDCGGATERAYLPSGAISHADPVVVYRAPDGSYRFPGDIAGTATAKYDSLGYTRVELRGWADVRRFERHMSARDRSEINQRVERQQAFKEAVTKLRRSDFHHQVRSMSPRGRAIAEAAMQHNDRKPGPRSYESGFHVEVYSTDRSNRD